MGVTIMYLDNIFGLILMLIFFSSTASNSGVLRDQKLWGIKECADVFAECLESLKKDLATQGDGGVLVWDKVKKSLFLILFNKTPRKEG